MPPIGLRARVAAALVLTAAVALGVAAIALLSPLEHKLRTQEVRDLVSAAVQSRPSFTELDTTAHSFSSRLDRRVRRVASITGARAALLDANGRVLYDTDPDHPDSFGDAAAALATDRAVRRIVTTGSTPEARVALRIRVEGHRYVLALRKPLNEQRSAVAEVRRAFGTAALVALAVSLLVSAAFAATVGRRLRRLRAAVRRFHLGGRDDNLPADRGTDEVGDLSRAFAEMAGRLRREEQIRRDFVSTASHELRTPLMSLQGRLELLADELGAAQPDIDDGRRQLASARAQADRLGRLAADLLDVSRLDAEVELRSEPVEMAELVRAVAAEFSSRAEAQQTSVELELEPVRALADPSATARVLRILLDNALRFSSPGAPIEVKLGAQNGQVAMTVTDHGPGIAEPDRPHIFERFARGSTASDEGGFGLGLAIGRELTQLMGGSLVLVDRNGKPGSSFRFTVPAASSSPNGIPT
jgi:signal transduction histidine kinase